MFSYSDVMGRAPAQTAPASEGGAPEVEMTGQSPEPDTGGARSVLHVRTSPAFWFIVLFLAAMYLARAAGFIRGQ